MEVMNIIITEKMSHMRLDTMVKKRLPWLTNIQLDRLINDERILLNGKKTKKGKRLHSNDSIEIFFNDTVDLAQLSKLQLDVLYEDEYLIAIDKPANIACHSNKKHFSYNIINYFKQKLKTEYEPRLLHRLDYETSGVLLLSKTKEAHQILQEDFENRTIEKMYQSIVHGHLKNKAGSIKGDIVNAGSRVALKKTIDPSNANAQTDYEVAKEFLSYSLIQVFPRTGKQHQIRVHLSSLGHPIVGDKLYGKDEHYFLDFLTDTFSNEYFEKELGLSRHALHASELHFSHPMLKKKMSIISKLPEDLLRFIKKNC